MSASRVARNSGADHVLSRFGKRDREQMAVTIEEAADAVEMILADGVDAAMNRYNAEIPGPIVCGLRTPGRDRVPGVDRACRT